MKSKFLVVLAGVALSLAACGDDNSTTVNENGMEIIAAGDTLADCTDDNAGQMVYLTDSAQAYYCAAGKWQGVWDDESSSSEKAGSSSSAKKESSSSVAPSSSSTKTSSSSTAKSSSSVKETSSSSEEESSSSEVSSSSVEKYGTDVVTFGTMTDKRDNHVYKTVSFQSWNGDHPGVRTWLAENLDYTYAQGTDELDSSSFCYGDDPANCDTYGRLYLWSAAMDSASSYHGGAGCGDGVTCSASVYVGGICPSGWHLPSQKEMSELIDYVDSVNTANGVTEDANTSLRSDTAWTVAEGVAAGTDRFGFNALPAGGICYTDGYEGLSSAAYFWTSTEAEAAMADALDLYSDKDDILTQRPAALKKHARSIRCIQDYVIY